MTGPRQYVTQVPMAKGHGPTDKVYMPGRVVGYGSLHHQADALLAQSGVNGYDTLDEVTLTFGGSSVTYRRVTLVED